MLDMNNDDLLIFDDQELMYLNPSFLEPPVIVPTMNDINILTGRMDQLDIDLNTQDLRNKLEKHKRQKLNAMVKNIEREVSLLTKIISQTKNEITSLSQQVENLTCQYNRDMAQLATVNYRCLSRMHNIIIATLPYINMPPMTHEDLAQMAYELLRTIYQLPIPQTTEV